MLIRRSIPGLRCLAIVWLVLGWRVICVDAAPANTVAQYKPTSPAALAHFVAGNRLFKSGQNKTRALVDRLRDLRAAIDEYRAGAAVEDVPAFDYNLGHAAELIDDIPNAVEHLQRFLDRAQPASPIREEVEEELTRLDPAGSLRETLRHANEREQAPPPPASTTPTPTAPSPSSPPPPTLSSTAA